MRYAKPQILRTEKALVAVQQTNNPSFTKLDGLSSDVDKICTPAAYEADE